jgi:hypothetical protein
MNKHDEGYVLAYVTIVLTVFCLIASMVLATSLKNVTNQRDSIVQMQDKYVAQGMIEQVVAMRDTYYFEENEMVKNERFEDTGVSCDNISVDNVLTLSASYGTVTIICEVEKDSGTYISYNITIAQTEPSETGVPET